MKNQEIIHYSTMRSPYGMILLAESAKGICALWLVDSEQERLEKLPLAFPRASFSPRKVDLSLDQIHADTAFNYPLDLRGTAFQLKVWKALLDTRWGDTLTYGELAKRIGEPNAVRAVATACGKNQIALIIPCHRIIRKDNKPSGYRWGLEKKEIILKREKTASNKIVRPT